MIWKKILKWNLNLFKNEINLGLRNKNMHAIKCNLSNYLKFSYCYLGEMLTQEIDILWAPIASWAMAPAVVAHPFMPSEQRADIQCSCGLCGEDEPSKI
jgi:hypothetical protein